MGSMGINESDCQTSKSFLQQNHISVLYQNDEKVNSGLIYLYMYSDIHIEYFVVTGLAQEPRDLVN